MQYFDPVVRLLLLLKLLSCVQEISSSLYAVYTELLFQSQCIFSLSVAVMPWTEVRAPVVSCQATGPLLRRMQSGQSCVTAVGPCGSLPGSGCCLWPPSIPATFNPNWPRLEISSTAIVIYILEFYLWGEKKCKWQTCILIWARYKLIFIQLSSHPFNNKIHQP